MSINALPGLTKGHPYHPVGREKACRLVKVAEVTLATPEQIAHHFGSKKVARAKKEPEVGI